jgi:hypothetical protein
VNLYAYAGNNPIQYSDPFGLDTIQIQLTEVVGSGRYHSSIRIAPDNGHLAFTLGAGPSSLAGAVLHDPMTRLVSDRDRPSDREPDQLRITLDLGGQTEAEVISRLAAQDAAYGDNRSYTMEPVSGTGQYNSNSYTSGMLRAAGVVIPVIPKPVPGFENPLPMESLK